LKIVPVREAINIHSLLTRTCRFFASHLYINTGHEAL